MSARKTTDTSERSENAPREVESQSSSSTQTPFAPVTNFARALAAAYASRRRVLRRGVPHTV